MFAGSAHSCDLASPPWATGREDVGHQGAQTKCHSVKITQELEALSREWAYSRGVQFKGVEGKVDPGFLTFKSRHIPGHPDVSPDAALATPTCV